MLLPPRAEAVSAGTIDLLRGMGRFFDPRQRRVWSRRGLSLSRSHGAGGVLASRRNDGRRGGQPQCPRPSVRPAAALAPRCPRGHATKRAEIQAKSFRRHPEWTTRRGSHP